MSAFPTEPPPLKPLAHDTACLLLPDREWVFVKVHRRQTPTDSLMRTCRAAKSFVVTMMKLHGVAHAGPVAIKRGFGLQLIHEPSTFKIVFIETKAQ